MNLVIGFVIVAAVVSLAVVAMLLVRRRAPEGSRFTDGDRASGVFGVLATGFSVLLGFVIFLSFTSYDESRTGAETEALVLVQQVETAQLLPESDREGLTGQLVCYGRSVVGDEWPRMQDGTIGDHVNPWGVELFRTLQGVDPESATEQSAYDKWLEQTSAREEARLDRIHGAVGIIPPQLWVGMFLLAVGIVVFALFFADSAEGPVTQGLLMAAVVTPIVTLLLMLYALDHPFNDGVGGLEPVAMQRSLALVDEALVQVGVEADPPCDERGMPT